MPTRSTDLGVEKIVHRVSALRMHHAELTAITRELCCWGIIASFNTGGLGRASRRDTVIGVHMRMLQHHVDHLTAFIVRAERSGMAKRPPDVLAPRTEPRLRACITQVQRGIPIYRIVLAIHTSQDASLDFSGNPDGGRRRE